MRHSLGTCPENDNHQITEIHASREGYEEYCRQCRKWRTQIDLRPIRQELREMGVDPDESQWPSKWWRNGEC